MGYPSNEEQIAADVYCSPRRQQFSHKKSVHSTAAPLQRLWNDPPQACPKMRLSASSCVGVSCSLPACISAGCAAATRWNTSRTAGQEGGQGNTPFQPQQGALRRGRHTGGPPRSSRQDSTTAAAAALAAMQSTERPASSNPSPEQHNVANPPAAAMSMALMGSVARRAASRGSTPDSA